MALPDPVIVVPGVTASYLRDMYPLPPETIWAVIKKDFDRAKLHPDDIRYEAQEPAVIRPDHAYEIAYELNSRPDWLEIPLRGMLEILEPRTTK